MIGRPVVLIEPNTRALRPGLVQAVYPQNVVKSEADVVVAVSYLRPGTEVGNARALVCANRDDAQQNLTDRLIAGNVGTCWFVDQADAVTQTLLRLEVLEEQMQDLLLRERQAAAVLEEMEQQPNKPPKGK